MTWHVVAEHGSATPDPEAAVWTVSKDPERAGWLTDNGVPGYGLTRRDAEELAQAANEKSARQAARVTPKPAARPVSGNTTRVPDRIMTRLAASLDVLREVRLHMEGARTSQATRHTGRYEAEVLANRKADVDAALLVVSQFRGDATRNGIDPTQVIAGLGGVADLTPSTAAAAWAAGLG